MNDINPADLQRLRSEHHRLSILYFEASATEAQERRFHQLSRLLADDPEVDPAAVALSALVACGRHVRSSRRRRFSISRSAAAAAVVAVVAAAGLILSLSTPVSVPQAVICRAGSPAVTDVDLVMASVMADLRLMGEAGDQERREAIDDLQLFSNSY